MIPTQTVPLSLRTDTLFCVRTPGKQRPYRKRKYSFGLWHRERESLLLSILPDSLPFHRCGIRWTDLFRGRRKQAPCRFREPDCLWNESSRNLSRIDRSDRCYFFNPFSVELLQKVLAQIYASYYENPRELLLFFYYPSEEYLSCLMTEEQLLFYDEIDTRDLFGGNNEREKILIFEVI